MAVTTVTVRRRLRAPTQALFDTLTDPQHFAAVRGIRSVEVISRGEDGVVSVGTVRRVNLMAGFLVEEIVGLDVPSRFDYRIRKASVRFEHQFGRIEFIDRGVHTEAIWTSTVAFEHRLVGPALAMGASLVTRIAFHQALREIDRAVSRGSVDA